MFDGHPEPKRSQAQAAPRDGRTSFWIEEAKDRRSNPLLVAAVAPFLAMDELLP